MLVLVRKIGESLLLGPDVEIKFMKFLGNQVQVSIDAPRDLVISRKETADPRLLSKSRRVMPDKKP